MADGVYVRAPSGPVRLVLLTSAALLISYVDRGNLATAVPLIHDELGLSGTQLGVLLSAFYYSYVAAMVPAGWLGERFGSHLVLAGGVAIWSLATFLTGFATSFVSLLLLRLLLGLGESATFPCSSHLFVSRLRGAQLDLANGVLAFSYLIGPALGTVLGAMLMRAYGWRAAFFVFGTLSLLCVWPLARLRVPSPDAAVATQTVAQEAPPMSLILKQRGLWGASLGLFSCNYNFYFILSWLPDYLVKEREFSLDRMATIAGSAYLINAVSSLLAGWAVAAWTRSGRSPNVFYKSVMAVAHIISMFTMIGMMVLPVQGCIACLCLFEIAMGIQSPGIYAVAQIIAGPSATGRWVGVQNGCGNLAGILAPTITGLLLDATGHFSSAFVLAGALNVLGLIGWLWMLPRIQPLDWLREARARQMIPAIGAGEKI